MPDKHEVGGSTPLEPTSRQCRQPRIGEVPKGFVVYHTMESKARRESLKRGESEREQTRNKLIQRISSIRERDSKRRACQSGEPTTKSSGKFRKEKSLRAGKERSKG